MVALERSEPLAHALPAALGDVVKRAAAVRGEAGAEDDPGVEQVRILDHAFAQTGDTLVEQAEDQPLGEIGRRPLAARYGLRYRASLLIMIEALSASMTRSVRRSPSPSGSG